MYYYPTSILEYFFIILIILFLGILVSLFAYPLFIYLQESIQIGQYIREDGPQEHLAKAKTATMGGLIFILITLVLSYSILHILQINMLFLPWMMGLATLMGLLGFIDDLAKILKKSNVGISGYVRLSLEFLVGLIAAYYTTATWNRSFDEILAVYFGVNPQYIFPWLSTIHVPLITYIYAAFIEASAANSVNIHDGMDGLAGGTSLLSFLTMSYIFLRLGEVELTIICACLSAGLLGFLLFNIHKAKIFMGDTGSLFLGSLFGLIIIGYQFNILLIALLLIPAIETLSVIFQVLYFKATKEFDTTNLKPSSLFFKLPSKLKALYLVFYKLTHKIESQGKRLFKMAPIHHHFELTLSPKFSEWHVVNFFWITQLIICVCVILAFNYILGFANTTAY